MASRFLKSVLLAGIACTIAAPAAAQPKAFVSVSSPAAGGRAIRIVDLQSMTVEASITGIGDEPGRMVANADRSRIYLSSWVSGQGRVYAIDTATRGVLGFAAAGNAQNRSIAISPDGLRVYSFKREGATPNLTIGIMVLDALTLAEIATVPITGANCTTTFSDIVVMPDGRIVAAICTDGVRVIDPVTFAVAVRGAPLPSTNSRLLGVSPDGSEVYVGTGSNAISVFGTTAIAALNVDTGASVALTWNVPPAGSYPGFDSGTAPTRVTVVPVVGGSPQDTIYLFSYFAASASNVPIAWARAADLTPALNGGNRHVTRLAAVGSTAVIGMDGGGLVGLSGRLGAVRRIAIDPASTTASLVTSQGAFLDLPGVSNLTDIVVVSPLFADGFEAGPVAR
jgi:DNA-binding beta-propeller fold protein YncE